MKYRIYIDEVGNSDLNASTDSNHRYLSLAGVIFELDYVSSAVFPAVESLKARYFASHPDDPVILHRKELVNKKPPFAALQDQAIEQAFNIAGLQVADLIAHPSFRATLARRGRQALPRNLGGQIAQILEEFKYYRSHHGQIDGWGRKWLP